MRNKVLISGLFFLLSACVGEGKKNLGSDCEFIEHILSMGTVFEFQYVDFCNRSEKNLKIMHQIKSVLDEIETSMSLYQSESEIRRLNRTGILKNPSQEIYQVVKLSLLHGELTHGYFDISVWPVLSLIKQKSKNGILSFNQNELKKLRLLVNYKNIALTSKDIRLKRSMEITLDGIAKGFAVDQVSDYLDKAGFRSYLINFSGNMKSRGTHANSSPWSVGVLNPETQELYPVSLINEAVASSGITSQTDNTVFSKDGKWHHLINPKTLMPANEMISTTIIGPSATVCDVLSTATFVMGEKESKSILSENYPEYRYRYVTSDRKIVSNF